MKRLTFQLSIGLIFALPLALVSFALAQAGAPSARASAQEISASGSAKIRPKESWKVKRFM